MDIYVLYLDVYFLENVLLNQILLVFTLILMGRRVRFIRLLIASLTGGALALVPMLLQLGFSLGYILFILAVGLFVIVLAAGWENRQELLAGTLYFYVLSFAGNRLYGGLERLMGTRYALCGIAAVAVMGMLICCLQSRSRHKSRRMVYPVEIMQDGKRISLQALLDTGNVLCEPINGRPVSIIEKVLYDEAYHDILPQHCLVIPYHSIGRRHGLLCGTQIEELVVWRGKEPHIHQNAVIALYEGKLSPNGSYQMILHSSLL